MQMQQPTRRPELERLDAFVGEWRMGASLETAADVRARTVFEWLHGEQFLVQRWEVEHPDAPDGIAIIGFDSSRDAYSQHTSTRVASPGCMR